MYGGKLIGSVSLALSNLPEELWAGNSVNLSDGRDRLRGAGLRSGVSPKNFLNKEKVNHSINWSNWIGEELRLRPGSRGWSWRDGQCSLEERMSPG